MPTKQELIIAAIDKVVSFNATTEPVIAPKDDDNYDGSYFMLDPPLLHTFSVADMRACRKMLAQYKTIVSTTGVRAFQQYMARQQKSINMQFVNERCFELVRNAIDWKKMDKIYDAEEAERAAWDDL